MDGNYSGYLIKLGMKEALLDSFNTQELQWLSEYAFDIAQKPDYLRDLNILASIEKRGKIGAIELVAHNVISVVQAKNLSAAQIAEILEIFHSIDFSEDINMYNAQLLARQYIVNNQQIRLHEETGEPLGEYQGEFFTYKKPIEER